MDPDGQAFRYSESTDGAETLADVDRINLVEFHEAMTAVANFLDGADVMLDEYASTKQEIDAYYAAELGVSWSDYA